MDAPSAITRPLILGTTGGQAGLFKWTETDGLQKIRPAAELFSVYSTALSPDGTHLLAGTKAQSSQGAGQRGNLELSATEPGCPILARYSLKYPVYALDWIDGQTVVCGTAVERNGRVGGAAQIFCLGERGQTLERVFTPRADAFTHEAGVIAVRAIGRGLLITLGYEGIARVWEIASGLRIAEFSSGVSVPALRLLPSILPFPLSEHVLLQYPNGYLRLLDDKNGWQQRPCLQEDIPFGGVCALGDQVLGTPWGSSQALCFDPQSGHTEKRYALDSSAHSLLPLSPETIAVLSQEGTVKIWALEPQTRILHTLAISQGRCLGGGMPAAELMEVVAQREESHRGENLKRIRSLMENSRDLEEIKAKIAENRDSEMGFQGLILLADWCRRQNKPLAELQVRRSLCEDLPKHPNSAPHLRIYGELLAQLGEPALALPVLLKTRDCDPAMCGVDEFIAELQSVPAPPGIE